MLLKNKVAVIYGAGGGAGGAVARAFAREGAKLFLTARHRASVEAIAKDIVSAGGSAEAAEVDALDEQAIDKHLQSVPETVSGCRTTGSDSRIGRCASTDGKDGPRRRDKSGARSVTAGI
jgi:NADP-dependent 3-hydroxy acid dehydrogenase YdfG